MSYPAPGVSAAGTYQFVVTGSLGPVLRSLLTDLTIEDRPPQTLLRLRHSDFGELHRLLEAIADGDCEVELITADA